jgi:hypothetical protein
VDTHESRAAADSTPHAPELIEVHVEELEQLFNSWDPSPFRKKDLDRDAEEFIVGWAREAPRNAPVALVVYVDRGAGPEASAVLREAVTEYFGARARAARQRLRELFRVGRISLLIGLVTLAALTAAGDVLANAVSSQRLGDVLRESLLIGGWVAMWRPLEIFLYEWWPIRSDARLYDRLCRMSVRIADHSHEPVIA